MGIRSFDALRQLVTRTTNYDIVVFALATLRYLRSTEVMSHDGPMNHGKGGDHTSMVREMRAKWLWTNFTVVLLGAWLVASPFTFGYTSRAMVWSDVISGALLIFFAALALWPSFDFFGADQR